VDSNCFPGPALPSLPSPPICSRQLTPDRMIRPILKYGETPLHETARPVESVTADIQQLIEDMIETMYAAPGVGLAAPQVGVPFRIFVVDPSVGRDPAALLVMVNPEFVERDGMQLEEEGCLSVPGFNATVVRPARAVVRALDRNGVEQRHEGSGLLARAFQHEMDHLDGTVFVDRLRGIKRDLIVRRIRKLSRSGKW
jgi:peptide deformylase